jgi:hypothetical protein
MPVFRVSGFVKIVYKIKLHKTRYSSLSSIDNRLRPLHKIIAFISVKPHRLQQSMVRVAHVYIIHKTDMRFLYYTKRFRFYIKTIHTSHLWDMFLILLFIYMGFTLLWMGSNESYGMNLLFVATFSKIPPLMVPLFHTKPRHYWIVTLQTSEIHFWVVRKLNVGWNISTFHNKPEVLFATTNNRLLHEDTLNNK